MTEQMCIIFAACFILRGCDKHIDFLQFMFLVGMICPLMQEEGDMGLYGIAVGHKGQ